VPDPREDTLVLHQRTRPNPTWEDEDVRLGKVLERGLGVQREHAVVGPDRACIEPDELELRVRQAREHLVGADGVEGRDAVEDGNGDLHATSSMSEWNRLR
jgi:hypothetical protein